MRKTFWMWLLGLGTLLCVLELWVSCPMASSALLEAASAVGAVLASPSLHSWRVTGVAGGLGGATQPLGASVPWGLAEVCVPSPWEQAARTGGLVELPLVNQPLLPPLFLGGREHLVERVLSFFA